MNKLSRLNFQRVLQPQVWWLAYLIMVLTGIGSDYSLLKSSMIEQLVFVFALIISGIHWINFPKPVLRSWLWLALFCLGFLLSPLLSSLANDHMLSIILTSKYRQLIKIVICMLCLFAYSLWDQENSFLNQSQIALVIAIGVLTVTVLVRYFILKEIHPETGRMNLLMRHGNANYVAAYLGSLFMLCALVAHDALRNQRTQLFTLCAIEMVAAACGLFASTSRMGVIAIFSGLLVFIGLESRRVRSMKPLLWMGSIMLIAATIGMTMGGFSRFDQVIDPSSLGRVQGIKAGLLLFSDSPFFGAGFDQTPVHIYQLTRFPIFREFAAPPVSLHNAWFQMLSEMGLFGTLSMLGIWGWTVFQLASMPAGFNRSILIGGLVVLFLNQQTLPVAYNDVFIGLAILPGVLAKSLSSEPTSSMMGRSR